MYYTVTQHCAVLRKKTARNNTGLRFGAEPLREKERDRKYGGAEHVELSAASVLTASQNLTWVRWAPAKAHPEESKDGVCHVIYNDGPSETKMAGLLSFSGIRGRV